MNPDGTSISRRPNPRVIVLAALAVGVAAVLSACRPHTPSPATGGNLAAPHAEANDPTNSPFFFSDVRFQQRPLSEAEVGIYTGDAACARCHPNAVRDHAHTRHARTLRAVTEALDGTQFRKPGTILDPDRRLAYSVSVDRGTCTFQVTGSGGEQRARASYVLGTGKNALTYLAEKDRDHYVKLRLSYYPGAGRWQVSPGNDSGANPLGMDEAGPQLDNCLLCHATVLQRDSGGLLLQKSHLGIGCERCHGPGKLHIDAIRNTGHDSAIERLAQATPNRIITLCGDCHRSSKNTDLQDPHTQKDLARFQSIALEQSACYRKSGTMTCITCHAPHTDAVGGTAAYDKVCRSCHGAKAAQVRCKVNPTSGCTGCHMPRQKIEGIPYAVYRNHWIRVWPESGSAKRHAKMVDLPSSGVDPSAGGRRP